VYGSAVVLKLVERFPVIIQLGAAVLAFTAAKMIADEPVLSDVFDPPENAPLRWALYVLAVGGVCAAGWWVARKKTNPASERD